MGNKNSSESKNLAIDKEAEYDSDHCHTILLSHEEDEDTVQNLVYALESNKQIILKHKKDAKISNDKSGKSVDEDTDKLYEYMQSLNGVLLLYTTSFSNLCSVPASQGPNTVQIHISGEKTYISASKLREKINQNERLCSKILALRLPGDVQKVDNFISKTFTEDQVVKLRNDGQSNGDSLMTIHDYWVEKWIVPALVTRKMLNRLVSQS